MEYSESLTNADMHLTVSTHSEGDYARIVIGCVDSWWDIDFALDLVDSKEFANMINEAIYHLEKRKE